MSYFDFPVVTSNKTHIELVYQGWKGAELGWKYEEHKLVDTIVSSLLMEKKIIKKFVFIEI